MENSPVINYEALSDVSSRVLPNMEALKAIYLKVGDPTEYRFASVYFPGGWSGWQMAINSQEFNPLIGQWRDELAAKLRSDALERIMEAARGETRDALSANKYIYEALTPKERLVGRPSKEHINKEAQRLVEENLLKDEAYERIFNATKENKEEII